MARSGFIVSLLRTDEQTRDETDDVFLLAARRTRSDASLVAYDLLRA